MSQKQELQTDVTQLTFYSLHKNANAQSCCKGKRNLYTKSKMDGEKGRNTHVVSVPGTRPYYVRASAFQLK